MPTSTELTDIVLSENRQKWSLAAYGGWFVGSGRDRPARLQNGDFVFVSPKEPVYGTGWGAGGGSATLSVVVGAPDSGVMNGIIKIRESFYREGTGETSLGGEWQSTFDLGSDDVSIEVTSNAVAPATEKGITHRKFWVNYVDALGVYYLAATIPYTGAADTAEIDVAASTIMLNEPYDTGRNLGQFPAVRTCVAAMGRMWGAVLEPRELPDACTVTFTNGSEFAVITGDLWDESDVYRGIVDLDSNSIVAFIDRVMTGNGARIRLPNDTREKSTWQLPTVTYDVKMLSGNESEIYVTPIYQGGPGGGIKYGIMSFNGLDVLRNEGLYASGAKIAKLMRAGDDVVVIYNMGVVVISGVTSVGALRVTQSVVAENVGTFNPNSAWTTPNGQIWFQGGGRFWVLSGGQLTDVGREWGVSRFWNRWIEQTVYNQTQYQVSYNPTLNMALLVNVPKKGEGTGELGTYALAICHDTGTINPLRFPIPVKSITCILHDDGVWQYYAGSRDGRVYKLMVRGQKWDRFYTSVDAEVTAQAISGYALSGVKWVDGTIYGKSQRILAETTETSGVSITTEIDIKTSNLISPEFTADATQAATHDILSRAERIPFNAPGGGCGIQYRWSFSTTKEWTLIRAHLTEEIMQAKWSANGR